MDFAKVNDYYYNAIGAIGLYLFQKRKKNQGDEQLVYDKISMLKRKGHKS